MRPVRLLSPPLHPVDEVPAPRTAPGEAPSPAACTAAVGAVIEGGGPDVVFQPQFSLSRLTVSGYEALARFPVSPVTGAERWFAMAHEVGLGAALELSALRRALRRRAGRPPGTVLAVNLSPSLIVSDELRQLLPDNLVGVEIEVTEHEDVTDVDRLRAEIDELRDRGARLAVDDVGTGHAGLQRVLDLLPDSLKLDRRLVTGVATDPARTALLRSMVGFARHVGATVCAEGVESVADLLVLGDLGVDVVQGWAVGRPAADFGPADAGTAAALRAAGRRPGPAPTGGRARRRPDLSAISERLGGVHDLAELGGLAAAWATDVGVDRAVLSVAVPDGGCVEVTSAGPPPTAERPAGAAVHDLAAPPTRAEEWRELARLGFGTALMVPVLSGGRQVGALECFRQDPAAWTRRQIRSAYTVADLIAPVLDRLAPTVRAMALPRPATPVHSGVIHRVS